MQQLVNDFKYSKLNTPDVVRGFLHKCRFGLRKSPLYPLNFRNKERNENRAQNRIRRQSCRNPAAKRPFALVQIEQFIRDERFHAVLLNEDL